MHGGWRGEVVKPRGDVTSWGVDEAKVTWGDKGREGGRKIRILG